MRQLVRWLAINLKDVEFLLMTISDRSDPLNLGDEIFLVRMLLQSNGDCPTE